MDKGEKRTLEQKRDSYVETGTAQALEAKERKNEKGSWKAESWSRTSSSWQPKEWEPARGGKGEKVSLNPNSDESWSGASSSWQPSKWDPARAGKGEKRSLDPNTDECYGTGSAQKKVESQGAWKTEAWSHGSSSWQTSRWRGSDRDWHSSPSSKWLALQPPTLPHGDRRFAGKKQDRDNPDASRVYVCDSCQARITFWKKAFQYDGQYVHVLDVRGRTVEELEQAYYAGEVNATWWCSKCHQRDGETLEDCRVRLGLYELDRMERTQRLIDGIRLNQQRHRSWQ